MEEKMLHGNTGWAASTHVTVVISVQISAEVRVKVKYEMNHIELTASGSERGAVETGKLLHQEGV